MDCSDDLHALPPNDMNLEVSSVAWIMGMFMAVRPLETSRRSKGGAEMVPGLECSMNHGHVYGLTASAAGSLGDGPVETSRRSKGGPRMVPGLECSMDHGLAFRLTAPAAGPLLRRRPYRNSKTVGRRVQNVMESYAPPPLTAILVMKRLYWDRIIAGAPSQE